MTTEPTASFDSQYAALRFGCAIVELTGWSSVTLTGADRQPFLHNFCTNDIKRLVSGASCEAFFTNVKGRIVGHGVVACGENELVVLGVPEQASRLIEHLDRYIIREDVQLRDTTSTRAFVLVAGGELARDIMTECRQNGTNAEKPTGIISWNLVGAEYECVYELASLELQLVLAKVGDNRCVLVGPQAFNTARIEAGVPFFGHDFDERNFPQEVGRNEQAISFTKGCYLGQETVARIDALGHVNQQLAGVRFFGSVLPETGAALTDDGRTVGHVTSATFSPRIGAPLALAMVRRENTAIGSQLQSPAGMCEVVELPV
jgi:folate-binding protein YgfZ